MHTFASARSCRGTKARFALVRCLCRRPHGRSRNRPPGRRCIPAILVSLSEIISFHWLAQLLHRRDPRNPAAPLRIHSYTHSDDITAVHFLRSPHAHSTPHNVLLSISSDGLISTSNADEADEDEAGLHVGNWGCSVAQAGWVHGRSGTPGVWASSDMETFSAWSGEVSIEIVTYIKHIA